jgi:hypothetical protein
MTPKPLLPASDQLIEGSCIALLAAEHQQFVVGSFLSVHRTVYRPLGITGRFKGLLKSCRIPTLNQQTAGRDEWPGQVDWQPLETARERDFASLHER